MAAVVATLSDGPVVARRSAPGFAARAISGARSSPRAVPPAPTPPPLPLRFRREDFDLRVLPEPRRPYRLKSPLPLPGKDEVATVTRQGVRYDHPGNQARSGINLLESYRLTQDRAYLDRVIAQAQRLVDRRVVRGDGWFYPFPFPHRMHRRFEQLVPPWYSMMVQGQALSLFCRLSQVPGQERWRRAADATFRSFLVRPAVGRPWGVYVVDGLLWLEEYAFSNSVRGDRTYNGHTFSAYGLYDYWILTQDPAARSLLQGAFTTTRDVFLPEIRNPHGCSKYCLTHARVSATYHDIHVRQLGKLHAITGDPQFGRLAAIARTDHPPRSDPLP
jgi:hypothetical protein